MDCEASLLLVGRAKIKGQWFNGWIPPVKFRKVDGDDRNYKSCLQSLHRTVIEAFIYDIIQ